MKKCPYCAEQIQDEAIKCRFCNEMLKKEKTKKREGRINRIISHSYPKIKGEGNEFEFTIENHYIKIRAEEDKAEERVLIFVDNDLFKTLTSDKADVKETVELFNHKVFVHYIVKSKSNPVWDAFRDALLFVTEGLFITVDGKPLEDSISDPAIRIKIASYGYYFFAGLTLMSIFTSAEMLVILIAIAVVAVTCGLLTNKLPLLFLPLGIIWGILELIGVFVSISNSSYKAPSGASSLTFALFLLLRVGIVLNFVRGIIAVIKIRTLREK